MNPTQLPVLPPAVPPHAPAAAAAPRLSLAAAALLLGAAAMLIAGGCAYALTLGLVPVALPGAALWAAVAAATGVLAAALPLGWLALRLVREADMLPIVMASDDDMDRVQFLKQAEREWARSRRYGTGAALLLVEVDRFARISEARGAEAGDALLAELLRQTAPMLRSADVLTRFSPGQMALFLAHADLTGALDVAERVRERAEQLELPWQPQPLRMTVSVGVAHLRPAHQHLQALVDDADDALAAARAAGGNCARAAPVDGGHLRTLEGWRDERRARPRQGDKN